MRHYLFLLSALCLVFPAAPLNAEPKAEAKAILDNAIKAMGGADKLAKLPATKFKSKGTLYANNMSFEYLDEWELHAPDRFRWNLTLLVDRKEVPAVFVVTDKTAWIQTVNAKARDRSEDETHMLKVDCRAVLLAHWLPALQEKGNELAPLGEIKIDDRLCVGLKVTRKGYPDADLFFDKQTYLPVKLETRFKETKDSAEVAHIFTFHDYKEIDGVKHFTRFKIYRDETSIYDTEVTEMKRLDKIDESRFVKP